MAEFLTTKDTTTKVIINYDKDPFTTDSAQQVIYTVSGKNNERKKYTVDGGFEELFGKVLVGILVNNKGQLVMYFEENDTKQQAEVIKNMVEEAKRLDEKSYNEFKETKIIDNFDRYTMPPKQQEPENAKQQPIIVEQKEKLMEKYKGVYTEQEIDMMINRVNMINAVDRFTGSV